MSSDNQFHAITTPPQFSCDLRPEQIQAGESVRVQIKNIGNAEGVFSIRGRSRRINFEPKKVLGVKLSPGQSTTQSFRPQPSTPLLIGGEFKHPFRLQVQSEKGATQILRGEVCSQAKFSLRQVLIMFFVLTSLFYFSGRVFGKNATPISIFSSATPTPTITPLPTLTPTLAPHHGEILYLSFDDGPSAKWTQKILDILAKYDAKATFFVVGEKAKEHPELIYSEQNAGHTIAHHTWSHISLNGVGFDGFAYEVNLTNSILGDIIAPCIRLPFADEGFYTEEYATQLGLEIIWWDVDPLDWSSPGQEYISDFVLSNIYQDSIILLHDGGGNRSQTVAALDTILRELSLQGYRFETLCK